MGRPRDIFSLKGRDFGAEYILHRIVYRDPDFRCNCGNQVFRKTSRLKDSLEHACVECGLHYMFVPRILKGATIF